MCSLKLFWKARMLSFRAHKHFVAHRDNYKRVAEVNVMLCNYNMKQKNIITVFCLKFHTEKVWWYASWFFIQPNANNKLMVSSN